MMGSRLDFQLNPRGTVSWRHDFDRQWSASADGGVVLVNPVGTDKYNPNEPRRAGTFGIYGGQIAYADVWGRATLSARRNVSPNMFLAQNTVDDAAEPPARAPAALARRHQAQPQAGRARLRSASSTPS